MDSGRFETFVDAILAIMMTVMVLKIPQPTTMDLNGIWSLRIMYFAYFISFIVIFSIWDHHRKLFEVLEEISNTVIWVYSALIFIITLVPYFTAWVAHHPYDLVPELMYGLIFTLVNVLYVIATQIAIEHDVHNHSVNDISFKELFILNVVLFTVGAIVAVYGYPLFVMIMCLVTVVTWNIVPYIQKTYVIGDDDAN